MKSGKILKAREDRKKVEDKWETTRARNKQHKKVMAYVNTTVSITTLKVNVLNSTTEKQILS